MQGIRYRVQGQSKNIDKKIYMVQGTGRKVKEKKIKNSVYVP
jgi:hypothetical protein